jgi:hypothetical protein
MIPDCDCGSDGVSTSVPGKGGGGRWRSLDSLLWATIYCHNTICTQIDSEDIIKDIAIHGYHYCQLLGCESHQVIIVDRPCVQEGVSHSNRRRTLLPHSRILDS